MSETWICIDIAAGGNSADYSRITSLVLWQPDGEALSLRTFRPASLSEERDLLAEILPRLNAADPLLTTSDAGFRFLSECFRQYAMEFHPCRVVPIAERSEEILRRYRLPVYEGELKHFYPDYKNYYYFPLEDTAYHKSVAQFADPSVRQQATARTAYTKRTGSFLPVLGSYDPAAVFSEDYGTRPLYVPVDFAGIIAGGSV